MQNQLEHQPSVQQNSNSLICVQCGMKYHRRAGLQRHIAIIHQNLKPYQCASCSYKCGQKSSLNKHVAAVHEKLRPFKCAQCGYDFFDRNYLKKHVAAVHEGIKPYQCPHCSLWFSQKGCMTRHVAAVHDKLKPFHCTYCSYECSSKHFLTAHVAAVHDYVQPFQCSHCSCKFSQKYSLAKHVASVHDKIRPYKCTQCSQEFSLKHHLNTHIAAIHDKIKPFTCPQCGLEFSLKHHLTEHMIRSHNSVKPFRCFDCSYEVNQERYLTRHIALVHGRAETLEATCCSPEHSIKSTPDKNVMPINEPAKKSELEGMSDCFESYDRIVELSDNFVISYGSLIKTEILEDIFIQEETLDDLMRCLVSGEALGAHNSGKTFRCSHCSYEVNQERYLTRHIALVHGRTESSEGAHCCIVPSIQSDPDKNVMPINQTAKKSESEEKAACFESYDIKNEPSEDAFTSGSLIKSEICIKEERLDDVMQDLQTVKKSESEKKADCFESHDIKNELSDDYASSCRSFTKSKILEDFCIKEEPLDDLMQCMVSGEAADAYS